MEYVPIAIRGFLVTAAAAFSVFGGVIRPASWWSTSGEIAFGKVSTGVT